MNDLISSGIHRACLWIICILNIVGNVMVLCGRGLAKTENRILSNFVKNLAGIVWNRENLIENLKSKTEKPEKKDSKLELILESRPTESTLERRQSKTTLERRQTESRFFGIFLVFKLENQDSKLEN